MNEKPNTPLSPIFARWKARLEHDPEWDRRAREAQAQEYKELYREALTRRCRERCVPMAADTRRWVFASDMTGVAASELDRAMERRGDPRQARPAIVVILGGAGVGKTAAMARAIARHQRDAHYAYARDASIALVARHRSFALERSHAELSQKLHEVDLLALDELGTEPPALTTELIHLVAARWEEGRATLLAGNLSPEQFTARYVATDVRFASRLASSGSTIVDVEGADFRSSTQREE